MQVMTGRSRLRSVALHSVLASATAIALVASSVSESEAKSRHRHRHQATQSWQNSNASTEQPRTGGRGFSGMASYYGSESGNRTASGARFNPMGMTAAHRSLPFGTKLKVTHGQRSVVVTVNDRGPFIRGRVLDLSKGAAQAIGLTSRGVGRVVAEVQ